MLFPLLIPVLIQNCRLGIARKHLSYPWHPYFYFYGKYLILSLPTGDTSFIIVSSEDV